MFRLFSSGIPPGEKPNKPDHHLLLLNISVIIIIIGIEVNTVCCVNSSYK